MEHAEIELLLCCEMPHTRHKRVPERPVIGPFGKDFVNRGIVESLNLSHVQGGVVHGGEFCPGAAP